MLWSSHLLDDTSVPAGLLTPGEAPAQDRFNVYSNSTNFLFYKFNNYIS